MSGALEGHVQCGAKAEGLNYEPCILRVYRRDEEPLEKTQRSSLVMNKDNFTKTKKRDFSLTSSASDFLSFLLKKPNSKRALGNRQFTVYLICQHGSLPLTLFVLEYCYAAVISYAAVHSLAQFLFPMTVTSATLT